MRRELHPFATIKSELKQQVFSKSSGSKLQLKRVLTVVLLLLVTTTFSFAQPSPCMPPPQTSSCISSFCINPVNCVNVDLTGGTVSGVCIEGSNSCCSLGNFNNDNCLELNITVPAGTENITFSGTVPPTQCAIDVYKEGVDANGCPVGTPIGICEQICPDIPLAGGVITLILCKSGNFSETAFDLAPEARPAISANNITENGCDPNIEVTGTFTTISWSANPPSALNYLSCPSGMLDCADPSFNYTGPTITDCAGSDLVYTASVDGPCGPEDLDITVTVYPDITGEVVVNCTGNSATLVFTPTTPPGDCGYSYLWSDGMMTTTSSLTIDPADGAMYCVTVSRGVLPNCPSAVFCGEAICCELDVTCPTSNGGTVSCADFPNNTPSFFTLGGMINDMCGTVTIDSVVSAHPGVCGGLGSKTYTLTDDNETPLDPADDESVTCPAVTFAVQAALPPTIQNIPAPITVACDAIPAEVTLNYTNGEMGNCLISGMVTSTSTPHPGACGGFIIRSWNPGFDPCGRFIAPAQQIITVNPAPVPSIQNVPGDITVACDAVPAEFTLTYSNLDPDPNCLITATVLSTSTAHPGACGGVIIRTWNAGTDVCGRNIAVAQQTITVNPAPAPAISTAPADVTIECGDPVPAANPLSYINNAADANCLISGVITPVEVAVLDECSNTGTITRTWSVPAADLCGGAAITQSQTITIEDTQAPVFNNCPANLTVGVDVNVCEANVIFSSPIANDECDSDVMVTQTIGLPSGSTFPLGTTPIRFVAMDDCGNKDTCDFTITVIDTQVPLLVCPNKMTFCTDDNSCSYTTTQSMPPALAQEDCGFDLTWQLTGGAASTTSGTGALPANITFELGVNTICYTLTSTTNSAITASCCFDITVEDCQDPMIDCMDDMVVECDPATNFATSQTALQARLATAADNCPGVTASATLVDSIPTCGGTYVKTYRLTATDAAGNSSDCFWTFSTIDTNGPTITTAAMDMTINCDPSTNHSQILGWLNTNAGAVASDPCGGGISWTNDFSPSTTSSLGCTGVGMFSVTFTATDECGNSSTTSANFIINDIVGGAQITCPAADLMLDCNNPANYVLYANWISQATAYDACGNPLAVTVDADPNLDSGCDDDFVVTFMATDCNGNSMSCTRLVTFDDNTAPEILSPARNMTVECDGGGNMAELMDWLNNNAGAVASDHCGDITWNAPVLVSTILGCNGTVSTLVYSFSATDECDNTSVSTIASFEIEDTTPPTVTPPANLPLECGAAGNAAAIATWLTQAGSSDACGGTPTINTRLFNSISGCGNSYEEVYEFIAIDDCGNQASGLASVIVTDNTPPTINCPMDLSLTCGNPNNDALIAEWLLRATTSDNCGEVSVSTNFDPANLPAICDAAGQVVIFTATDECGLTNSCTATIFLNDTQAPVFLNCPADMTVNVDIDVCGSRVVYSTPVAHDACDQFVSVTRTAGIASGGTFPLGTTTIEFTATDDCGLTATCEFDITVQDSQMPDIICPANLTICADDGVCTWASPAGALSPVTSDNCPTITVTYAITGATMANGTDDASGETFALGTSQVCYTINDGVNPPITCCFDVTVIDCEAPDLSCPVDMTVECDGAGNTIALNTWLGTVSATDNCDGMLSPSSQLVANIPGCGGTSTRIYRFVATDASGNSSVCFANFAIEDTTPPSIDTPAADETAECDGHGNAVELLAWLSTNGGAVASDLCGTVSWTNNFSGLSAGVCPVTGMATVTFTATDECGNSSNTTATFTIQDTQAPVVTCPANITLECNDPNNDAIITNWLASVSATDACDPNLTVNNNYPNVFAAGACGQTGVYTVTFTTVDDCGNASVACSSTITIEDTTPPDILSPAKDITVECDGNGNMTALQNWLDADGNATAGDACGTISWNAPVLMNTIPGCGGTSTAWYMFTANDECGNTSAATIASFTIEDTSAPTVTPPAATTVECDGAGNTGNIASWLAMASLSDVCDPNASLAIRLFNTIPGCGGSEELVYEFIGTDACGNFTSVLSSISILDRTMPDIICPADLTIECGHPNNPLIIQQWLSSATISDVCSDVSLSTDYNPDVTPANCLANAQLVTFTATDACGNTNVCTANIWMDDTTDPVFVNCPLDMTVNVDVDLCGSNVIFSTPVAEDNCDVQVIQTLGPPSGGAFPTGTTLVRFVATDDCGNTASCEFNITVNDSDIPTILCPSNTVVQCTDTDQCSWLSDNSVAATHSVENCPGFTVTYTVTNPDGTVSNSAPTGINDNVADDNYVFALGTSVVCYTITDASNNSSSCCFEVLVEDCEAPDIICPMDMTVECDGNGNTAALDTWLASVSASDNCTANPLISNMIFNTISGCGETNTTVYQFTATDEAGNTSICYASFTIEDTTVPSIDTPASDMTVECDGNDNVAQLLAWLNNNAGAVASDLCGDVTWSNNYSGLSLAVCPAVKSATVLFTATDECGNANSTSATFTIQDTQAPVISCPSDITVECNDPNSDAIITNWLATASAQDVCEGTVSVSNNYDAVFTPGCGETGIFTVTFTATDNCMNSATPCSARIVVEDTTRPDILSPAKDTLVECDGAGNTADLASWLANHGGARITDGCGDITWDTPLLMQTIEDCDGTVVTYVYMFMATDACGNTSAATIGRFIIEDTAPPTLTPPVDMTVECNGSGNQDELLIWLATASVSDVCDANASVSNRLFNTISGCGGTNTLVYEFTAMDACGNVDVALASFIILDNTMPSINCPANLALECGDPANNARIAFWLTQATTSDICSDVSVSTNFDPANLPDNCGATVQVVTFTATDDCGNTNTCTATITIDDSIDPVFVNCPDDMTVAVDVDVCGANVIFSTPVAQDQCDMNVAVSQTMGLASGTTFPTGNTLIEFTATDDCGNTATCQFTITVVDTDIPIILCPSNDVVVCTDDAVCTWASPAGSISPTHAIENCPFEITYTITGQTTGMGNDDASGTVFNLGRSTVCYTLTETNAPMNSFTCCFDVVVEDCEMPDITCPQDMTVECDGNGNTAALDTWLASISATDNCDQNPAITNMVFNTISACGGGSTTVYRFIATDAAGNSSVCFASFTIEDTTAPSITDNVPFVRDVECDGNDNWDEFLSWLVNNAGLTATDVCSNFDWTNDYHDSNWIYPDCVASPENVRAQIDVVFTATDECGNSNSATKRFRILDTTNPVWDIPPSNLTLECTGMADPLGAIASWLNAAGNGVAIDECSENLTYTNNFTSLSGGCGGTSLTGSATVVFTATDACGNAATASAIVTVVDNLPPDITSPAKDITVECNGTGNTDELNAWLANHADALANDICGGFMWDAPVLMNTIDMCGGTLTYVYMFTATDDCGNTSAATIANFVIEDTTDPSFMTDPSNLTVECDGNGNVMDLQNWLNSHGGATAIDICSEPLAWEYDLISTIDTCSLTATYEYRFTVYDDCDNSASRVALFTIRDITDPVIIGGEDLTVECDQGNAGNNDELVAWLNNNAGAIATDNCSFVTWSNDYDINNWVNGCGDTRYVDVTFTVRDDCGNTASITRRFGTVDTTPPMFTNCPRPAIRENAEFGICQAFINFSLPLATDNCSTPVVRQIDNTGLSTGSMFPVGTTVLIWEAEDACGNKDTCSFKVIVNDKAQDPVIECPADVVTDSDPGMCGAVVNSIAPVSVSDNCIDNVAVTYNITGPAGALIGCGITDASGFKFPVGMSTVTYTAQDQPILLITEVRQSGMDALEITNFGPAAIDISCLSVSRIVAGVLVSTSIVNSGTVLLPGEVIVINFSNNLDVSTPAVYVIHMLDHVIDVVATNGFNPTGDYGDFMISMDDWDGSIASGDIYRTSVCDTNTADDWAIASDCNPLTIGALNPGLPAFAFNGSQTSLQTVPPNTASCTFKVTVNDDEDPFCASLSDHIYQGASNLGLAGSIEYGNCFESVITVSQNFVLGDVNILDLRGLHAEMSELTFRLISPAGTEIELFSGLCTGTTDFDVNLDSDSLTSVALAPCGPLGQDGTYSPVNHLRAFKGELSGGDWTLQIEDSNPGNVGQLDSWLLELFEIVPYAQQDVILDNDPGECGANFMWMHPFIGDNCCVGTIEVEYTTSDGINVPMGGFVTPGGKAMEFFEVGTTTVKYTITDASNNTAMCSFDVTVLDVEPPVAICPRDITFTLDPGECEQTHFFNLEGTDNCAVDTIYADPPSGFAFQRGTTTVTIIVKDPAGNADTCTFDVTVLEPPLTNTQLACNDLIHLSLSPSCMDTITADMILEGGGYRCYDDYIIMVLECHDPNCPMIPTSPVVTQDHIGDTLTVKIIDPFTGNSCWGRVLIEDKLVPEFECPADLMLSCNESTDSSYTGAPILLSCESGGVDIEFSDTHIDNGNCGVPRAVIERLWTVTDSEGNAATCLQTLTIHQFDLGDVAFPKDDTLDCGVVALDPSLTSPDSLGRPTINGQSIHPGGYCSVSINMTDEIFDICPGSYEILRTWKLRNTCFGVSPTNPIEHTQIIKVLDQTGPQISGLTDITISTDVWRCEADWNIGNLALDDNCSSIIELNIIPSAGTVDSTNTRIEGIPAGIHTVTINAADECYNYSDLTFTLTVIDDVPPVAVCDEHTVVNISATNNIISDNLGLVKVFADAFDDGSFDNCSNRVWFKVIRMDEYDSNGNGKTPETVQQGDWLSTDCDAANGDDDLRVFPPWYQGPQSYFDDYVKLCCDDVETGPVMVVFAVFDIDPYPYTFGAQFPNLVPAGENPNDYGGVLPEFLLPGGALDGHYSLCMVEVEVQDKVPPFVVAPPDLTVTCDFWFPFDPG